MQPPSRPSVERRTLGPSVAEKIKYPRPCTVRKFTRGWAKEFGEPGRERRQGRAPTGWSRMTAGCSSHVSACHVCDRLEPVSLSYPSHPQGTLFGVHCTRRSLDQGLFFFFFFFWLYAASLLRNLEAGFRLWEHFCGKSTSPGHAR